MSLLNAYSVHRGAVDAPLKVGERNQDFPHTGLLDREGGSIPHLITRLPADAEAGIPEAAGESGRTHFDPAAPWSEEAPRIFSASARHTDLRRSEGSQ